MNKLTSNMKITQHLSGDASAGKAVAWVDMRDYLNFCVSAVAAALTGAGITAFKIRASAAANGANPVDIKIHAVASAPDAAGDTLVLECNAAEVAAAGTALRYVAGWIDTASASDNIVCTYILGNPRHAGIGLTADAVA